MVINTAMTLAMAAVCLAAVATTPAAHAQAQRRTVTVKHAPITNPGDVSETWDTRHNVIESKQYEQLLRTNPAFRRARMQKECGGITLPELRESCLASFEKYKS
jgi:curli biogenesis system outer membrane secretion channel CsgG